MTRFAQQERAALADLLEAEGPDAPTLCEGWATRDLAAHLVLRERRPDAAAGIAVPPLSGYTERVQKGLAQRPYPELVAAVRSGPPLPLRPLDEAMNTVEYFVHHEDVRRARAGWEPRPVDPALEDALWRRLRSMSRLMFRRAGVGVALETPTHKTAGVRPGEPLVTLAGPPSELVLFASGRGDHARVDLRGDPAAVERLRQARLGV